jgi:HK97 family phage portal protein
MNFWKRWFSRKDSQARIAMAMTQVGRPVATPRNYEAFAKEGYQANVIAYKCVTLIARACAGIPTLLYETDRAGNQTEVLAHPVLDLLKKPNPLQVKSSFIEAVVAYFLIAGNSYVEANRGLSGGLLPMELWPIRPDRMKIVPGTNGMPEKYQFQGSMAPKDFPVDRDGRSNMFHMKSFHPTDLWYGMSPIEAASISIDQHNESGKWNLALLQNMGTPSGALIVKADETNPTGALDTIVRANLEEKLNSKFGGSMNAGRMMLLEGGMDWKSMGFSAKDMDWLEGRKGSARDISLGFGVPPILLNIPGDATFNNYAEARASFYQETVLPLLDFLYEHFTNWLIPIYETKRQLNFGYDEDRIEALEPRRKEKWEKIKSADFLTYNERREALGYDKLDNPAADELYIPSSLTPLGVEPTEPTPVDPSAAPEEPDDGEPGNEDEIDGNPEENNQDDVDPKSKQTFVRHAKASPTQGMIERAIQGLDFRREFGRGGSELVAARAKQIAAGKPLTRSTLERMVTFFENREAKLSAPGGRPGTPGFPSDTAIEWMLWGGDPAKPKGAGRAWAEAALARLSEGEAKQINPVNRIDRVRTWKSINETRRKLGAAMALDLDEDFEAQARALAKAVQESSPSTREFAVLKAIDETNGAIEATLRKHFTRALKTFSEPILQGAKSAPGGETKTRKRFNDFLDSYIDAHTGDAIREIGGTTIKKARLILRDAVSEAIETGDSNVELAKTIQAAFDGVSESRAMTIARTEMGIASNQGAFEAAKALDVPGLVKEWVSIQDDRTRDDDSEANHLDMNGVQVGMDEKFIVPPDSDMDGPGDPSAPAAQVINCRCAMVFSRGA